jgi:hypothetical protein
MNRQQILQAASKSPQFPQAVQALEQQMSANPITSKGLAELIKMIEFALKHPQAYPRVVQAAIKDGHMKPGDMPEQFNQVVIISILAALYIVQDKMSAPQQGFARGGLAQAAQQLQAHGRHGDTMLAHINPQEAAMLQQAGGSGSINPHTGLPEFFNLGSFLKAVLPIALNFIAPGIGLAIGEGILGVGAAGAGLLGGAVMGAGTSALTGGNIAQGAILGGLGEGLGSTVGGYANEALGLGLGEAGVKTLGSGLMGGLAGAVTGQGFAQGAVQGAMGQYMGSQLAGASPGLANAGQTFGNMMTAGYDPKSAVLAGGLSGLVTGIMGQPVAKPSDAVVAQYKGVEPTLGSGLTGLNDPVPGTELVTQGGMNPYPEVGQGAPLSMPASAKVDMPPTSSPWTLKNAMLGMTALGMLQDAPEPVKTAVNALSPEQKKYFNLPNVTWDWTRMQQDAEKSGVSLAQFMSQNWPQITGYSQGSQNGNPSVMSGAYNQPTAPRKLARGGPLSQIAYMARGSGTGRDDTIDAKLSDGEYVMDAETVALLGDGSNKAGAERLDAMREAIRAHKGKTLAKGAISPDAKSPLAYLKGAL